MSDNGKDVKLILKAELDHGEMKIQFGHDVPNVLYDRAIRLLSLHLDNFIIEKSTKKEPKAVKPLWSPEMGKNIIDSIRRGR